MTPIETDLMSAYSAHPTVMSSRAIASRVTSASSRTLTHGDLDDD